MYMTLDFWVPLTLGGLSLGIYLACVLHYRELVEVRELYKEQEVLLQHVLTRDEYNGWSNRETWAFTLIVDNDQALNSMFMEFLHGQADEHELTSPVSTGNATLLGYAVSWWYDRLMEEWCEDEVSNQLSSHMYLFAKTEIGSDFRIDWTEVGEWACEKLVDYDPHREVA